MTVSSAQPTGAPLVRPAEPHAWDTQLRLVADLVAYRTRDTPSIAHLLALVDAHLRGPMGLRSATVFAIEGDDGTLRPAAALHVAPEADVALAGRVFLTPAGGPPLYDGSRLAVRLRTGGRTLGVIVLDGAGLRSLQPDVLAAVALHFASTLEALASEGQRQFIAHSSATLRKLFEQGTAATSVEAASELLARSVAEAFRTEHAALHLVDQDGRIRHAVGVGIAPQLTDRLDRSLVGKVVTESPAWRAVIDGAGPMLVDDAASIPTRPGGFVETMGLRSYVAVPLISESGPVGMVLCGDSSRTREWTARDRVLAGQLAVEGSLILDTARLREAERQHLQQLTQQAFSDSLTGLPNRSHLMDRAREAIDAAGAAGGRTALLLVDLDGFKQVNDAAGHHAGDELLRRVGERMLAAVRADDLVARLGGDEFAILLTDDADTHRATAIAERIWDRLREPFDIDGERLAIGASIGVALFPDDSVDIATLLRAADAAMYRAKRRGGGVRLAH